MISYQCGCGNEAVCYGRYEDPKNPIEFGCSDCCGHGREDGWCRSIADADLATLCILDEVAASRAREAALVEALRKAKTALTELRDATRWVRTAEHRVAGVILAKANADAAIDAIEDAIATHAASESPPAAREEKP